jgi:chromosome segregation ATPase
VWLHTILKNYPAAMLSADGLSLALADRPLDSEQRRAEHEETVGFLGRLLGFLGGPAAESVTQDERKALEKKLLARLGASHQAQFENARNGVLARYIELTGESADSRDRAVAAQQAEREKTLAELQADRAQLERQSQALEERREKIQDELRSELAEIAAKDQPLVRDLSQLDARANLLSADLVSYSLQIARLQQLAAAEKDSARRQQYLFEAESLSLITARIDADLYSVNRQSRALQQQRAALSARQAQARSAAANQVQRLERELGDLAKRDRRNDGIEKRASRPAAVTTSKSRSLAAQASALSTYDAFPLEAAKARLLESLR